jgi:tetratricopeptide (TPR) repeat protein
MSALRPGDVIDLGHVKLRFCAPGERFTPPREQPDEETTVAGRKRRAPVALVAAVVVALGAAAAAIYFLRGGTPAGDGELSAAGAVKAGDALFLKKEFQRAVELYEQAAAKGENPPNLPKASEEARAQEIDQDLDRAVAAGDFDKAKALLEKCGDDEAWYCHKAREKAVDVRQGYTRSHLEKARAAKGVRADACQSEVRLVLGFDPSNTEARELVGQCAPAPAAPPKEVHKAPQASQSARDEKARSLLNAANALTQSKQFPQAMAKYQAALDQKPSGSLAGLAYRGLGTAAVYAGDPKAAARWFKKYLPYVDDPATRNQVETLIRQYGGE